MDVPNARRIARAIADGIVAGRACGRATCCRPSARWPCSYGVGRPLIREALRSVEELGPHRDAARRAARSCARRPRRACIAAWASRSCAAASRPRSCPRRASRSSARPPAWPRRARRRRTSRASRRRSRASSGASRSSTCKDDLVFHLGIAAAAHNPVIEMMLESIAPQTVALMVRSVGDPQVMVRSQPYHRVALEAIGRRDPDAARGRDPRPPQRRERALRRRLRAQRRGAGGSAPAEARDADLARRRRRGGPRRARDVRRPRAPSVARAADG